MNKNQNDLYNFTLIAPYGNLAALCRKMSAEFPCELEIRSEIYMEAAVPVALEAAHSSPDVILSRGATAAYVKSAVDIPVVSVSTTALDLLQTLKPFAGQRRRVAFFTYKEPMLGVQLIADTLNLALDEYLFHNTDEVRSHMLTARARGTDLVVGGIVAVQAAKPHGLDALLLESGEGAVWSALREATDMAEIRRRERQRRLRLTTILNTIAEGIVVTDENDRLILMNPTAERLMGVSAADALGKEAREALPNTGTFKVLRSGQAVLADIQDVAGTTLVTNRVPIKADSGILGVVCTFSEALRVQQAEQRLRGRLRPKGFQARYSLSDLHATSAAMQRLLLLAEQYAGTDATVVLRGESGTGKELFAQGIHRAGKRASGPFVAVNCAAIPEPLLESELFGYEEGAFTGARRQGKSGFFEMAHQGTLFLDEIGELPLSMQARLLRVLQEREVVRIGGSQVIPIDIRIICATNRDLAAEAQAGRFRRDLFYRLNVLRLSIPPLRERKEDILPLAHFFLCEHAARPPGREAFDKALAEKLMEHEWPGNVRELSALMERLALAASMNPSPDWETLLQEIWDPSADSLMTPENIFGADMVKIPLRGRLKEMVGLLEQNVIERLLERSGQDRDAVAARLGISRVSLWRKEQKAGTENDA